LIDKKLVINRDSALAAETVPKFVVVQVGRFKVQLDCNRFFKC
jgi:hypothetical protein